MKKRKKKKTEWELGRKGGGKDERKCKEGG